MPALSSKTLLSSIVYGTACMRASMLPRQSCCSAGGLSNVAAACELAPAGPAALHHFTWHIKTPAPYRHREAQSSWAQQRTCSQRGCISLSSLCRAPCWPSCLSQHQPKPPYFLLRSCRTTSRPMPTMMTSTMSEQGTKSCHTKA